MEHAAVVPSDELPRHRIFVRGIRDAALFVAGFFLVAKGLGLVLPLPDVPEVAAKWRHFAANRDRFDTVFVGSSRIRHHVDAPLFDRLVTEAGAATRSFNLGISGMWPPESYYALRRILAARPGNLRWVVIELMDGKTRLDPRDADTLRMAYWHDLRHTAMAIRAVWESPARTLPEKRWLTWTHARIAAVQLSNIGRGADILAQRWTARKKPKPPAWIATAGFEPEPAEPGWSEAERTEFIRRVEAMKRGLAVTPVRPGMSDELRDIVTEIRAIGARPIFVLPPSVSGGENFAVVPDGVEVIALNDPAQFPELFRAEDRYDMGHFNATGAKIFTETLARAFSSRAREQPAPSR